MPKIHDKVSILYQESYFYVTSSLGPLEENFILAKIISKKFLNCGLLKVSELFLSYHKLMYGTNKYRKRNTCILEDSMRFFCCVDFTRLLNVMSQFPGLSIDILTDGITSPL